MELAYRLTEHALEPASEDDTARVMTRQEGSIKETEQQEIAAAMSNYVYLAEYEVLICKEHGYAVRGLDSHLRLVHTSYTSRSKKARAALRQHHSKRNMPDPSTVRLPEPEQPAIEYLCKQIPGYYYISNQQSSDGERDAQGNASTATDSPGHCGFTTSDRTNIGKHCRNAHGWKSTDEDRQC